LGEALARHYSDAHKMSVICLRIGRVKAEDRPTTTRDVAVWCSQRDIVRMIEACIEAPRRKQNLRPLLRPEGSGQDSPWVRCGAVCPFAVFLSWLLLDYIPAPLTLTHD